ncbi:hypothetical protein Cgig2_033372 [Carnegiea gigantea]|uniref:Protein kinase domain-containing protein n=1 Tax=Carnegiea gigantea TaxID=171969 RepID=A0A9Q1QPA3_9CARY|nr:hypothetical protein Cgig2_033372 [Carnegiea gigantea]
MAMMMMRMRMVDEPRKSSRLKQKQGFEMHLNLTSGKRCFTMWHTLFQVHAKYVPIKPIGKGAYGMVCSCIDTETKERVAIKKISNVFENRVETLRMYRELVILRHLSHDNVITLKDVMVANSSMDCGVGDTRAFFNDVYMVFPLMDTDLHNIIYSSPLPLPSNLCKYFLFQLLRGLQYLHSANVLHRDLKPGNLLVNSNGDLKICDFGLARCTTGSREHQLMTEYVVTRWYRAPELLLSCACDNHGAAIDVWSVGCIFAEILGRKPVFPGTDSHAQLKLIISVLGTQPESNLGFILNHNAKATRLLNSLPYTRGVDFASIYPQADPLAIDLLKKMLVFDPTKRITATEALQHPYMADLYDPLLDSPAPFPFDLSMDDNVHEKLIRELIWGEMLCYHPEEAYLDM